MGADFSGYVTRADLKCTDGRTIKPEAFQHMDGQTVPLVWQHGHDSPDNVLGHVDLEARPDGVYGYAYFNSTPQGKNADILVQHKDITRLSIYANGLVEKAKQVYHGFIREVSLVLAGANPGAFIDQVAVRHADGSVDEIEGEAIIYTGLVIEHEDKPEQSKTDETVPDDKVEDKSEESTEDDTDKVEDSKTEEEAVEHSAENPTVQEIYDSMNDAQKQVVQYMVGAAIEGASSSHSDKKDEGDLEHKEGTEMTRNVFDQNDGGDTKTAERRSLSHDDMKQIVQDAVNCGSLKAAVEGYALKHNIDNIDVLFPDPKSVDATPQFDSRRMAWVQGVINGTRKTPFSRIKSLTADITMEEARAKGYIKGNLKKEEFFSVSKRTTGPTTIYKKQKLDRDDILDITDFDVVAWMKGEMQLMLREEVARAILIGDGRDVGDEDKVKDPMGAQDGLGIRSILNDHELYAAHINVTKGDGSTTALTKLMDELVKAQRFYKGSGSPTLYTTLPNVTDLLLLRDSLGRRLYRTRADLAAEMGVADIVDVEVMEDETDLFGIIVNLSDYTVGTDRGGETTFFDFFDIDYNQYKYLYEGRASGALTKIRSALVVHLESSSDTLVDPITEPTFVESTGVVTIPTQTGVVYKNADTSATLTAGAQTALAAGDTLNVIAVPASGYYFESDQQDQWSFTRPA